eukprot:Hpha_TRINITY_DN22606_c0_g1::TRINITY_DN22606_c0_g1_i1::g.192761::m.192761
MPPTRKEAVKSLFWQIPLLCDLHRRQWGKGRWWLLIILELVVPAVVIACFAGFEVVVHSNMKSSDTFLRLYPDWNASVNSTGQGHEVRKFDSEADLNGRVVWVSRGSDSVPESAFAAFVGRLENETGLSREYNTLIIMPHASTLEALRQPVGPKDWGRWQQWRANVTAAHALVSFDSVIGSEASYSLYVRKAPNQGSVGVFEDEVRHWQSSDTEANFLWPGTLGLQMAVEQAMYDAAFNREVNSTGVRIVRGDGPGKEERERLVRAAVTGGYLVNTLGFFAVLSLTSAFSRTVQSLVTLQQTGAKDYLICNGMSPVAYHIAGGITAVLLRLPLIPMISIPVSLTLLPDISHGALAGVLTMSLFALVAMGLLVSKAFTSTRSAVLASLFFHVIFAGAGLIASGCGESLFSSGVCYQAWEAWSLIPTVGSVVAFSVLAHHQLTVLNGGQRVADYPDVGNVVVFLFFDVVLYIALWYLLERWQRKRRSAGPAPSLEESGEEEMGLRADDVHVGGRGHGVSLEVERGSRVAVLGQAGEGKTKLV